MTGLLRRHWLFAGLLGLGVLLRVLVCVAYRPAIFYIDSMATYVPAVKTLDPTGQNPIGYVFLLLKPVLAVGDFTAVAVVQHLLGVGMALVTYALLVHKGAWRWLAAVATTPILLDAYQLQIEHNIMSDPLFQAMLVAALALLAWPRRPGWPAVAAAGLLLGAAVSVRTVGQVLVVPAVLYLLLVGGTWRARAALAGLVAVCFALPVVGYATYHYVWSDRDGQGRFSVSSSNGNALYGRVATFADCTGLDLPAYERPLCPTQPAGQRLGPDWWAHDPGLAGRRPVRQPARRHGRRPGVQRLRLADHPAPAGGLRAGGALRRGPGVRLATHRRPEPRLPAGGAVAFPGGLPDLRADRDHRHGGQGQPGVRRRRSGRGGAAGEGPALVPAARRLHPGAGGRARRPARAGRGRGRPPLAGPGGGRAVPGQRRADPAGLGRVRVLLALPAARVRRAARRRRAGRGRADPPRADGRRSPNPPTSRRSTSSARWTSRTWWCSSPRTTKVPPSGRCWTRCRRSAWACRSPRWWWWTARPTTPPRWPARTVRTPAR